MKIGELNINKAYLGNTQVPRMYLADTMVFPYPNLNYLAFIVKSTGSIVWNGSNGTVIQYSKDGSTWTSITASTATTIPVVSGDTVLFRGTNQKYDGDGFSGTTCWFDIQGNIMSLLYGDDFEDKTTLVSANTFYSLFRDCTGLTSVENLELPATTLSQYCYSQMFYGCNNMVDAPVLPATTLTNGCYQSMFAGCSSLRRVPNNYLSATALTSSCYSMMFRECASLVNAPQLPATSLGSACYYRMFAGCTSLVEAPELPAKTLANNCYFGMFSSCSSLRTAPVILPATTLTPLCYSEMFLGCVLLTTAPELPATTLVEGCYENMFRNCGSLNFIRCLAKTGINENNSTYDWVRNVASTGTFVKINDINWPTGNNGIPTNWTVKELTDEYLTLKIRSNGSLRFMHTNDSYPKTIQYSKDRGQTWVTVTSTLGDDSSESGGTLIPVIYGDYILLKGTNESYGGFGYYASFERTNVEYELEGNIMSLIYGDDFLGKELSAGTYNFSNFFAVNTGLTSAKDMVLPESVTSSCYNQMFYSCTTLTTAPVLPATTLADMCYAAMFAYCSSLANAPALPAIRLTDRCYAGMFYGCESLTSAPELPARTLVNGCYSQMFQDCSSLNYIKCLATDISAENCTRRWTDGVARTGTFVKSSSMSGWSTGVNGIPTNWIVEDYNDKEYLAFIVKSDGNISWYATSGGKAIQYSKDYGSTWTSITASTATTIPVLSGDTVMFKGVNPTYSGSTFSGTTCQYDAEGNIMSLLYGDDFEDKTALQSGYTFQYLFNGTNVVNTNNLELPATTLTNNCYNQMFANCTALTSAPVLPAETLANSCYADMFAGCTSLVTAPALPATSLTTSCYNNMFSGCTSLVTAPALPATTLANNCYYCMFRNCTALTTAPSILPATTLTNGCYQAMFYACSSLTTAPELPATTLNTNCYYRMFDACTGLTTAPSILPATTLVNNCYYAMFRGCSSLTTAPELPATTLASQCYQEIFKGCNSLNYIKCLATDISASACTTNWVQGVSSAGTFVKKFNMTDWSTGVNGIPTNWIVQNDEDGDYLRFIIKSDGNIAWNGTNGTVIEYIKNNSSTWTSITASTATTIPVVSGETVFFKGNNDTYNGDGFNGSTCQFDVEGNIMSLIYSNEYSGKTTLVSANTFTSLFSNCTGLTSVENLELPATTLTTGCYYGMFQNCTSLVNSPELPATTLTENGYREIFMGCTSLTTVPELPATTLAKNCYNSMFYGCTSLITAPELPATTIADYCYVNMFRDCTGLTTAPSILPATTLTEWCYTYMFHNCASLVNAPVLPATILSVRCYSGMFFRCSSLNYIKCLAKDISASRCTYNWVGNVASAGTFVKSYSMINWTRGADGIPEGWTVENYDKNLEKYITFKVKSDGNIAWNLSGTTSGKAIQYSKDSGSTWTSITSSSATTIPVVSGDTVLFKGTNQSYSTGYNSGCTFDGTTCQFDVEGNIMSLIYGDNFSGQTTLASAYTFHRLFRNCTGLTSIENLVLPATTLTEWCYQAIFYGCTGLISVENLVLPATTLTRGCYASMFTFCTSLTTAPSILPATTLATRCYTDMFQNCTSLVNTPVLPATTLAQQCYQEMFYSCTTLTTAPALSATTLANGCYFDMFRDCTSLVNVPSILPATTLATECYGDMFHGCSSLTTAPELPATTLVDECYIEMFWECSSLNYIKCLATDIPEFTSTLHWVDGVSSTGTFVKNASMSGWSTGVDGIPNGWTVIDA